MGRKFGNNDQQYQVQNDTTMTNKQRLYAIVGFVCLFIFGFYNMRNQYINTEEPPVEQVTQTNEQAVEDIYEEPASETDETDIAEQDIEEEPVQTIQYAFDYQWDIVKTS